MHLKSVSVDSHTLELENFVPETERLELKLKFSGDFHGKITHIVYSAQFLLLTETLLG